MNNQKIILTTIFQNPTTPFYIRELARKTRLHPNTIITSIKKLQKQNLIIIKKHKHITEIQANPENSEFTIQKKLTNLSAIYNSGLIEYLLKTFSPKSISLIGSYSRGEDIENSDVDLVIITNNPPKSEPDLEQFEKRLKKKIHPIFTTYKKMSEEFYINMINGLILQGALEKK